MTEETENLVLSILREMRGELGDIRMEISDVRAEQHAMSERIDALSDDMNARFDQVADLMTVVVSAQADLTRRVETLEEA